MNTEPKILLTINLEGGILLRGEPEVRKYYLTKKDLFPNQKFKGTSGNKVIRSGKYIHTPLHQSEAKQKITLCKDAYDYMTSLEIPKWFMPYKQLKARLKEWAALTPTQRLEAHLTRTCEHFRGKSFTYQIIEDDYDE